MGFERGWRPGAAGRSSEPEGSRGAGACPFESEIVTSRSVGGIRQRSTFAALRRPAGRATVGPLRVSWVPPGPSDAFPLVGYAIGRRCGNAVRRNRLRRQLRVAVERAGVRPGSYLVVTDPAAIDLDFTQLASTVRSAMDSAARRGSRQ
jgi:ribonuclease P protein component